MDLLQRTKTRKTPNLILNTTNCKVQSLICTPFEETPPMPRQSETWRLTQGLVSGVLCPSICYSAEEPYKLLLGSHCISGSCWWAWILLRCKGFLVAAWKAIQQWSPLPCGGFGGWLHPTILSAKSHNSSWGKNCKRTLEKGNQAYPGSWAWTADRLSYLARVRHKNCSSHIRDRAPNPAPHFTKLWFWWFDPGTNTPIVLSQPKCRKAKRGQRKGEERNPRLKKLSYSFLLLCTWAFPFILVSLARGHLPWICP